MSGVQDRSSLPAPGCSPLTNRTLCQPNTLIYSDQVSSSYYPVTSTSPRRTDKPKLPLCPTKPDPPSLVPAFTAHFPVSCSLPCLPLVLTGVSCYCPRIPGWTRLTYYCRGLHLLSSTTFLSYRECLLFSPAFVALSRKYCCTEFLMLI